MKPKHGLQVPGMVASLRARPESATDDPPSVEIEYVGFPLYLVPQSLAGGQARKSIYAEHNRTGHWFPAPAVGYWKEAYMLMAGVTCQSRSL